MWPVDVVANPRYLQSAIIFGLWNLLDGLDRGIDIDHHPFEAITGATPANRNRQQYLGHRGFGWRCQIQADDQILVFAQPFWVLSGFVLFAGLPGGWMGFGVETPRNRTTPVLMAGRPSRSGPVAAGDLQQGSGRKRHRASISASLPRRFRSRHRLQTGHARTAAGQLRRSMRSSPSAPSPRSRSWAGLAAPHAQHLGRVPGGA